MKISTTILSVISILLFSCQKEISLESPTTGNPPAVLTDSTLISTYAEINIGKPVGYGELADTQRVLRFYYDNLNRIILCDRYDSLYTAPWVHDKYFYNSSETLPYKITRQENWSGSSTSVFDTAYFVYDLNGKLLKDSVISHFLNNPGYTYYASASSYTLNNNICTIMERDYTNQNGSVDTSLTIYNCRFITGNDKLTYQTYMTGDQIDTGVIYTFTYDNHPNPLYKPRFSNTPLTWWSYGRNDRGCRIWEIQKNNCTAYNSQYIYPPVPVISSYTYTYRNDGYPIEAVVNNNYSFGLKKVIYKYKL
jgi:hypothetical protein